jgi:hypothetical protein
MIRCDLCQTEVDGPQRIFELSEDYRTENVREVCTECMDEISKLAGQLNVYLADFRTATRKRWGAAIMDKLRREEG